MKKNRRIYASLVFLFLAITGFTSHAQTRVTGKVTDEANQPLPGVVVTQTNTQNKTSTDGNGVYVLTLQAGSAQSLTFNYVGYGSITRNAAGGNVDVSLIPTTQSLNDVVVVGYTTQKRANLTGAVGILDMADAEKRRVPDVAQVLQGQVAGVTVTQSTGAPGDPINIRIRGEGTFGSGNSPLFVVDGVPTVDISHINTNDIKSLNVLKDASSAAIYGSRAANGVVIITTKQGVANSTAIDINYFNGIQQATNLPTMLNTTQYLNKIEEAWGNSGYSGTNPYIAEKARTDLANTDWLDELFVTGHSQVAQVSASGGSEKVQYFLSGAYYKQNGIVVYDNDQYQRINFRPNITANLTDRLKVGANLQISNEMQDALSSRGDAPGIIRHAFLRPPVISVYKSPNDPTYTAANPFTDLPFYKGPGNDWDQNFEKSQNPIALAYFSNDKRNLFKTFGNAFAAYSFLKDKELTFRSSFGVNLLFRHNKAFLTNFGDNDGGGSALDVGLGRINRPNGLNEERGQELETTWTNTLNYTKTFGSHSLTALVGSEFIKNKADAISASRRRFDYTDPNFQYIDFGGLPDLYNGGSAAEYGLFSLFSSVDYNYGGKYFLTANIRADRSSRFGENNQWGYFPSVAAAWRISGEDFLQDNRVISNLKLRATYGSLGNQGIPNYAYLNVINKVGNQFQIVRYGNPDIKWETTTQLNIGLDVGLLKNSLNLSVDYFIKNTSDILLPIGLPGFIGNVSPSYLNTAKVENKGLEVSLGYTNNDNAFKYGVNANFSTLTNVVKKLHPNYPNITSAYSRTEVGHSLNQFYGFNMIGVFQTQAEIDSYLTGSSAKPGDIKFEDINGDKTITDADKTYIGNNIPKFSYGINLNGSYKGFDLSVLFQGVEGIDKFNQLKQIIDFDTRPFNYTTAALGSWSGPGTSNTIPRVSFDDNGSSKFSNLYVEDASYIRLKNVELGYSFSGLQKLGVKNVRLYVSGQNLWTSTNYSGLDPETVDQVDYGTYPQSRAILFGVNVKF